VLLLFAIAQAAEEAVKEVEHASGGIGSIGLDGRSLILQIINFAILLLLLKKFAYGPIMSILEERRRKIEESLRSAKEIETEKALVSKKGEEIIKEAHAKAQSILDQGKRQASEIINNAEAKARERDEQIMKETKARIEQEATEVRRSLRGEAVNLVTLATERIIGKKIDAQADNALIRESVQEVTNDATK